MIVCVCFVTKKNILCATWISQFGSWDILPSPRFFFVFACSILAYYTYITISVSSHRYAPVISFTYTKLAVSLTKLHTYTHVHTHSNSDTKQLINIIPFKRSHLQTWGVWYCSIALYIHYITLHTYIIRHDAKLILHTISLLLSVRFHQYTTIYSLITIWDVLNCIPFPETAANLPAYKCDDRRGLTTTKNRTYLKKSWTTTENWIKGASGNCWLGGNFPTSCLTLCLRLLRELSFSDWSV